MAEHDPEAALALWRASIAATDHLSDQHEAVLTKAHASFDAPAVYRQPLLALTKRLEAAVYHEHEVGRAYLAARDRATAAQVTCSEAGSGVGDGGA